MEIAVRLDDVHALGRVEGVAESHALAADEHVGCAERRLHVGEATDGVDLGTAEP